MTKYLFIVMKDQLAEIVKKKKKTTKKKKKKKFSFNT